MDKVILVIIYNHRYDKNIKALEAIYGDKFSTIYHLMPFYDGDLPNVIPVYENSFYFQGYISQALSAFFSEDAAHYLFIGDDLLLNPAINEKNYKSYFKLDDTSSFIPSLLNLHEQGSWPRVAEAMFYRPKTEGVEIRDELPDKETALKIFAEKGITFKPLDFDSVYKKPHYHPKIKDIGFRLNNLKWRIKKAMKIKFDLPYPMIGAYADIVIIDAGTIKRFAQLCGVFAATNLFVEVAIPTAMVLSAKNIVTEKDLEMKGGALWTKEDYMILEPYNNSLSALLGSFPPELLYIHPVKLSRWNK